MSINLLMGLLPLIAFVIIDSLLGLKSGLLAALFLALAELLYSFYEFGGLDWLSLLSLGLVAIFGALSFAKNNPIYIKLQPVFLGVIFGIIILAFQLFGEPLLLLMLDKYASLIPPELVSKTQHPEMRRMLGQASLNLGIGLLLHAALVAYAAFRLNKWWWLFIRGIGLYIMMAIAVLLTRLSV